MLRIYIDTAAFFSGIYSTKGYAHDLLNLASEGQCELLVYHTILVEMVRNLSKQKDPKHLLTYQKYIASTPIHIVATPTPTLVR